MESISVQELKKKTASKDADFVLIDVREPDEYKEGAIPSARNIPMGDIENAVKDLKKYRNVYVNCRAGGRSSSACSILMEHWVKVVNVEGGLTAWEEAGFEVANNST